MSVLISTKIVACNCYNYIREVRARDEPRNNVKRKKERKDDGEKKEMKVELRARISK